MSPGHKSSTLTEMCVGELFEQVELLKVNVLCEEQTLTKRSFIINRIERFCEIHLFTEVDEKTDLTHI